MNQPYIKNYDERGFIINPITYHNPYISYYPNRKMRRYVKQKNRLHGESKNHHLRVFKDSKLRVYVQTIKNTLGKIIKRIKHGLNF